MPLRQFDQYVATPVGVQSRRLFTTLLPQRLCRGIILLSSVVLVNSGYTYSMRPNASKNAGHASIGAFGPLEQLVLTTIRKRRSATVADIHADLAKSRSIAYTTVMTTMSRLANKGLLERRKQDRRYVYQPVPDEAPAAALHFKRLFAGLFAGFRGPAIRHFVESVSALDDESLAELEREVRLAKRRRKHGEK